MLDTLAFIEREVDLHGFLQTVQNAKLNKVHLVPRNVIRAVDNARDPCRLVCKMDMSRVKDALKQKTRDRWALVGLKESLDDPIIELVDQICAAGWSKHEAYVALKEVTREHALAHDDHLAKLDDLVK